MRRFLISFTLPTLALLVLILWQFIWQVPLAPGGSRAAMDRAGDGMAHDVAMDFTGKQCFLHPSDLYRARPDILGPEGAWVVP